MGRPFSPSTAEQAVAAIESVVVNHEPTPIDFVADFCDLPRDRAQAALDLAVDLGFLSCTKGFYQVSSALCRFFASPSLSQKAAVLRVLLEHYDPFVIFRERLVATSLAVTAARQTKVALKLEAHHEDIKDTLVSLGTYCQALESKGGGHYSPAEEPFENTLVAAAQACRDATRAEALVRSLLGLDAGSLPREEILVPLASALEYARDKRSRSAVLHAGNAVESYLVSLSVMQGVNLSGATGINAKLERFKQQNKLPAKLIYVGKYLGHVRNAADHGTDPDTGVTWTFRDSTGLEYVHVACSFIASTFAFASKKVPEI